MSYDPNAGDYLWLAVENIAYGLRQLTNPFGHGALFREVKETFMPTSTVYPNARLFPGGSQNTITQETVGTMSQTFTAILRVYVAKSAEGYDGEYIRVAWLMQPLIINHINNHPDLVFTDTQAADLNRDYPDIPELQPDGVICNQTSRLGFFRDQPEHIGMEFGIELPFQVERKRTYWTGALR